MTTTQLLTQTEEAALAAAVEIGVLAEEACRGGIPVEASLDELHVLAEEGRVARERLLLANVGLVKTIAGAEVGASAVEYGEIVQEGHLALAEALARYDYRRGRLGPYAAAWIRAGVRAAVGTRCGRTGIPPRDMVRYFAARRAESDLMQSLGRSLRPSEVPGRHTVAAVEAVAMPAPFAAALLVPDQRAESQVDDVVASDVVRLLGRLPASDRQVLRRRFGFDGPPAARQEVAQELGVSEATVRRAEVRGLTMLRRGLARVSAAEGAA